jgi:hypothetical protein
MEAGARSSSQVLGASQCGLGAVSYYWTKWVVKTGVDGPIDAAKCYNFSMLFAKSAVCGAFPRRPCTIMCTVEKKCTGHSVLHARL